MKSPWKVTYSPQFNSYGIYREKDVYQPNTTENRELHPFGHIFGDRDTAQRVADDLNEEERKNEFSDVYNDRPWNNSNLH